MRQVQRLLCLGALAGLASCGGSPATRMLTLDAVAPAPAAVQAGYRGRPVAIPAVHVPAVLDRAEFAHQIAAGEVKVDDFARWAAPLGLLARDTLVRDLIARLPAGAVLPPGAGGGGGVTAIDVTILSFDAGAGAGAGGATMAVVYRPLPGGAPRQLLLATPGAGGDPAATARAFSTLLGQLADRMAADIGVRP